MKPLLLDWAATLMSYFFARADPRADRITGALVGLSAQGRAAHFILPTTKAMLTW